METNGGLFDPLAAQPAKGTVTGNQVAATA